MFDVVCGICKGKMKIELKKSKDKVYRYFICEKCKKRNSGKFIERFFDEKYEDKIRFIEIMYKNSAKIYFKK